MAVSKFGGMVSERRKSKHILEMEQPLSLAILFLSWACYFPIATVYMPRAWEMLSSYAGPERKIWGERSDCSGVYLLGAIYF